MVRLLSIPFVALRKVLHEMDYYELGHLAACSKKTRFFLKATLNLPTLREIIVEHGKKMDAFELLARLRIEDPPEALVDRIDVCLEESSDPAFELTLEEEKIKMRIDILKSDGREVVEQEEQDEDEQDYEEEVEVHEEPVVEEEFEDYKYFPKYKRREKVRGPRSKPLTINSVKVQLDYDPKTPKKTKTYWEDQVEGVKTLGSYLEQVYGLEITKFHHKTPDISPINSQITEYAATLPIDELELTRKLNNKEFTWILNKIPAKNLEIAVLQRNRGQKLRTSYKFSDVDSLIIYEANWLNKQTFMNLNCEEIEICNTQITNHDMKRFIKKWAEGGYPRLRKLEVELKHSIDMDIIFGGLDEDSTDYTFTWGPDYRIIRSDGTRARISFLIRMADNDKRFNMYVTHPES